MSRSPASGWRGAATMISGSAGTAPTRSFETLLAGRGEAPIAACGYENGRGHPLAFSRTLFGELASLHGDKGVWKLLDRHAAAAVDVPVRGSIPLDVDTREDYEAVLAEAARGTTAT